MIALLPAIALFVICIYGFARESRLDKQKFAERKKIANQHVLDEVERFLNERELES